MKLEGLVVNFLGDSITEGYGTTGPDKVYHQLIKEKCNLNHAYNYGIGGTRIARQIVPTKDATIWDLTFEVRSDIMDRNADLIVVFGGTNDFGHGDAPFGDIESEDKYTFCGAVNSLISKLKNDFNKSDLVFMTPIHRVTENDPSAPDGKILKDYAKAMADICKKRNVKLIDLFEIDPIDPHDETLVPDGLHPSDAGHIVLAEVVMNKLLEL